MSRIEQLAEGVTLYLGDCREILPTLDKVDALISDVPYGINAKLGMGGGSKGDGGMWKGVRIAGDLNLADRDTAIELAGAPFAVFGKVNTAAPSRNSLHCLLGQGRAYRCSSAATAGDPRGAPVTSSKLGFHGNERSPAPVQRAEPIPALGTCEAAIVLLRCACTIEARRMTRHRWPKDATVISPNKSERECLNGCGTIKVSRHEYPDGNPFGIHWPEFWNGLDKFEGKGTPPCTGRAARPVAYDARDYPL